MENNIQLIVGLGNPGSEYANTRHNAGAWFIEKLAHDKNTELRVETKFKGLYAKTRIANQGCHLLIPNTFMNLSGEAIASVMRFYKINPENILVAHDDLDLPPGAARLKFDGGHGGHNGLRNTIAHLNTNKFHRLRLGIGHPGNAKDVIDYVLKKPSKHDYQQILSAIDSIDAILPEIVAGHMQRAMKALHTAP